MLCVRKFNKHRNIERYLHVPRVSVCIECTEPCRAQIFWRRRKVRVKYILYPPSKYEGREAKTVRLAPGRQGFVAALSRAYKNETPRLRGWTHLTALTSGRSVWRKFATTMYTELPFSVSVGVYIIHIYIYRYGLISLPRLFILFNLNANNDRSPITRLIIPRDRRRQRTWLIKLHGDFVRFDIVQCNSAVVRKYQPQNRYPWRNVVVNGIPQSLVDRTNPSGCANSNHPFWLDWLRRVYSI